MAVSTDKVIEIMGEDYAERFLETMYDQPVENLVAEIIALNEDREDVMGHGPTEDDAIEHLIWLLQDED